jgi:hypothetical protein
VIGDEIVKELRASGYHPRSSKQSDFQSLIIIRDLVAQCPLIAARAKSGELVAKLRHHQTVNHADWVVDIVIGTCAGAPIEPLDEALFPIVMGPPVIIQIAIELKSIWTEHGKARLNRLRDFNSFHSFAHAYAPETVAAAFLIINSAEWFWSPLRDEDDLTQHGRQNKTARQLAKETLDKFRSIHLRNSLTDPPGLEALGVLVVEHDNIPLNPNAANFASQHKKTIVAPTPPNVAVGDPLHYQSMIQRICNAYTQRFPTTALTQP